MIEAKDTVMKIEELLDIEEAVEDATFSGWATDTKPVAIAKAQAEISFKAGVREVVEAIHIYNKNYARNNWGDSEFRKSLLWWVESKLKEWGVK